MSKKTDKDANEPQKNDTVQLADREYLESVGWDDDALVYAGKVTQIVDVVHRDKKEDLYLLNLGQGIYAKKRWLVPVTFDNIEDTIQLPPQNTDVDEGLNHLSFVKPLVFYVVTNQQKLNKSETNTQQKETKPKLVLDTDEATTPKVEATSDNIHPEHYKADINHMRPSHYEAEIDVYDFALANNLGGLEMNICKYVLRYKKKNGLEDLQKAKHTLERLIEHYAEKQ